MDISKKQQATVSADNDMREKNPEKMTAYIEELISENRRLKRELENRDLAQMNSQGAQQLRLAELIIDNSPAVLFRRLAAEDPKKRKMVYVSPNISRFGYEADDFLLGRIMFRDIVYPPDSPRTLKEIRDFVKDNIENYTQFYRIITRSGEVRWIEDRTSVVTDEVTGVRYHQGIVIDIHERKIAEEKLQKSEEKYRRIVETTGEGFLLLDADMCITDCNSAYENLVGQTKSELTGTKPFPQMCHEYGKFSNNGENRTADDYLEFECTVRGESGNEVPVLVHANTLRSDSSEIIGTMAFVTDLTAQKKALALAGEVQRSLLPDKPPDMAGFDIAGKNIQCEEVGGDYFDYLYGASNDSLAVVVGDITGHGVDSALLMSSARAFLRLRVLQNDSPSAIVTDLNRHIVKDASASGRFMTLFYIYFEPDNRRLTWVRAGHDPALLYDPALNTFEELKGTGIALGIDEQYDYPFQTRRNLHPSQIVTLGTDGIWESSSPSGEMFGKERLKEVIRKRSAESAENILEGVIQELEKFTDGKQMEDDITFVVIKLIDSDE